MLTHRDQEALSRAMGLLAWSSRDAASIGITENLLEMQMMSGPAPDALNGNSDSWNPHAVV